jgi:hypothetical protein
MGHLPVEDFGRIVERFSGDHRVRDFGCANPFRCMAFAQLTFRERSRDFATCLRAQPTKLDHMGIRGTVARSTPAGANEARNWRIYAEFAQHLIRIARRLYLDEPFGVGLEESVYALDSTTIDLCLTLFPWAPFRSTKAAIKLHTLPEPGAFYVMDRGYLDLERQHRLHAAGAVFVTRAKCNRQAERRYSQAVDRSTGLICDQTITVRVYFAPQRATPRCSGAFDSRPSSAPPRTRSRPKCGSS